MLLCVSGKRTSYLKLRFSLCVFKLTNKNGYVIILKYKVGSKVRIK